MLQLWQNDANTPPPERHADRVVAELLRDWHRNGPWLAPLSIKHSKVQRMAAHVHNAACGSDKSRRRHLR